MENYTKLLNELPQIDQKYYDDAIEEWRDSGDYDDYDVLVVLHSATFGVGWERLSETQKEVSKSMYEFLFAKFKELGAI